MTAVPGSLARFVEDIHALDGAPDRPQPVDRLPDGRAMLVIRALDGGQRGDVTVSGPRTRALFKRASGFTRAIQVRFKPGWSAPLLGVPTRALTDRIVDLEDLWGADGRALCDALLTAPDLPAVADHLARAFALRLDASLDAASAHLARRAVRLLEGGDEVRVERVANRLGVTSRHLRRAFVESIGLAPKQFARSVRLQRALRLTATSRDWGRIATDAGYYDHAHLIADFRELVGLTPVAFARRALERPA